MTYQRSNYLDEDSVHGISRLNMLLTLEMKQNSHTALCIFGYQSFWGIDTPVTQMEL